MTSVHREKSREGINKGVMRKEKKERGNEEEEAGTEKKCHAHHGTNAVCGCWSKCVVVGVGSINSSVTVETKRRSDRAGELKSAPFLCKHKCHTVIYNTTD